ncbi:MAG: HdeA/HdeB family chaperone [Methyloceanibacter sp.]|jgi:acid stress chaperone HdeB
MKRNIVVTLGFSAALAVTSAAPAQVMLDLNKVTCDQFIKYKVADPKLITVWLSGYFHGKRGDTMVDTQRLNADADAVEKYCFKNPEAPLMPSVEAVIGPRN